MKLKTPIVSKCLVCGKNIINKTRRIKHICSEECKKIRMKKLRRDLLNTPRGKFKHRLNAFKMRIKKKKSEDLINIYCSLRARYQIVSELLEKRKISSEILENEYKSLMGEKRFEKGS